jgi:hypothetical protein
METKLYTKHESHVGGRGLMSALVPTSEERRQTENSTQLRPFSFWNMQYAEQHEHYWSGKYKRCHFYRFTKNVLTN